jgi:hypothetical protein
VAGEIRDRFMLPIQAGGSATACTPQSAVASVVAGTRA